MSRRDGKRILIVGANFAGLAAAQRLGCRHRVEVIDRAADFEYLPNIHELVSGIKSPSDLRLSRRRLLRRWGHRFLEDEVADLDPAAGTATTASGERLDFDLCLVTVGGVTAYFGVEGAERFSLPFKSVDECAAIGARLRLLMATRRKVSVVIVGGGLEGVECLGEILRRYRKRTGLALHVVEQGERLLPEEPRALDREIRRLCKRLPVRFHTGETVETVSQRRVHLSSGEVHTADLTIWTGGATAGDTLHRWDLTERPGEWAPVRDTLQSVRFDNVFVAGDAARRTQPIDKQAYFAVQMGERAADNLARGAAGRPLLRYRPSERPTLVSFGDLSTFLIVGRTVVAGSALAAAKEAVFQVTMAGFDPPLTPLPFLELQRRLYSGFEGLALPTLLSPRAALRLAGVRLLYS